MLHIHVHLEKVMYVCILLSRRLPSILAAATSVYGSILKIDSTKKVCRKLQGVAAGTASWATNVGNERGEVVASVLTASEDVASSLKELARGLVRRYQDVGEAPPVVLNTDRQGLLCCERSFEDADSLCWLAIPPHQTRCLAFYAPHGSRCHNMSRILCMDLSWPQSLTPCSNGTTATTRHTCTPNTNSYSVQECQTKQSQQ